MPFAVRPSLGRLVAPSPAAQRAVARFTICYTRDGEAQEAPRRRREDGPSRQQQTGGGGGRGDGGRGGRGDGGRGGRGDGGRPPVQRQQRFGGERRSPQGDGQPPYRQQQGADQPQQRRQQQQRKEEPEIPVVRPGQASSATFFSSDKWGSLGASEEVVAALTALGIMRPSHIQAAAYRALAPGAGDAAPHRHVVLADHAGSGKTLAYLLPLLQLLKAEEKLLGGVATQPSCPRLVLVVPTAELAAQVLRVTRALARAGGAAAGLRVRSAAFTGGRPARTQREALEGGVDVAVGTPGRLAELLREGALRLDFCRAVVCDEVDVLLGEDFSFAEQVRPLRDAAPEGCRWVFATATIPEQVYLDLEETFPGLVAALGPGLHRTAPGITEQLVDCSGGTEVSEETGFQRKAAALFAVLQEQRAPRTIVFCNKIESCRKIENFLNRAFSSSDGVEVLPHHAAITDERRDANLKRFLATPAGAGGKPRRGGERFTNRKAGAGERQVLVCTDRASRGLDSAFVEHVVLFDLPRDPSEYLRRVGRTVRGAGGEGVVSVLTLGRQVALAKEIIDRNQGGLVLHRVPAALPVLGAPAAVSDAERLRYDLAAAAVPLSTQHKPSKAPLARPMGLCASSLPEVSSSAPGSFYELHANDIDGRPVDFARFKGQASCSGVGIIMEKVNVNGRHASPVWNFLKRASGDLKPIPWNYTKFLVGHDGCVYGRYLPRTRAAKLEPSIRVLLAAAADGDGSAEGAAVRPAGLAPAGAGAARAVAPAVRPPEHGSSLGVLVDGLGREVRGMFSQGREDELLPSHREAAATRGCGAADKAALTHAAERHLQQEQRLPVLEQPGNHYLLNNTIPILNICFASVLLPALLACWAIFGWRVVRYVTGRSDPAKMDAPLWVHWPKLVLWATHMTLLLALTIVVKAGHGPGFEWDPLQPDCRSQAWSCSFSPAAIVLLSLNTACLAVYWLAWTWCIARSFAILRRLPYSAMRMGNLVTRLQVRLRGPPILFFLLCVICLTFVKINTCSSYMISWLGYLPMQVVASSVAVANAYITMPKRPNQASILQVWLQEFAWTEADGPRKHSERSSSLPPESYEGFCLDCEPIYCMETAIKMMHWCFLAYDIAERPDSPFTADTACRLYDLEHFEVFWEKSLDTKAVVGWNSDTVVIAFRGTTSLANVRADIQVWRTRFPPDVGSVLLCSAPLVHRGFLTAYTANNFNERLLGRLEKILYRCALDHREEAEERGGEEKPVQVYVTGHSLGGALAQLCAYDVKKRCPCAEYMVHVKCYAFGAPRVGNHSWAKEYNTAIPDTWCLINKDDVVTTAGKLFFMYSRTGHKVLLNKLGDIIVRPNYVETAFRWAPGGGSIRDHLLTSYQKALSAVVAAQFGTKSVRQGREGALSLAQQQGAIRDVLERSVLTAREVEVLQTQGWDAYQRLLRQRARLLRASRRRRSGSQELQEVVVEAAPAAQQQPQQSQLQAIAEEEQAESPFAVPPATPPATLPATPQALPPPPQHLGFKGRLAALVSRDLLPSPPFVPLERSLSGSSLASMGSSGVPPSPPANPRGSMRDGPAFPLVLDWGVCAHSEGSMRAEQLGSCSSSGDSGANPS
ncbi:DEAD-box ATP-dependent RNA helicase 50 isoform A [Micractinium conductrix]|uniref:DEAD-box ATP-dependent RNA helicase 50 isoform A n=1 Tax=Micractinium conductrix TaxID=554055 RepID=A0A2P6VGL6_9CHLO|nr:DEAD-box ATP-dependent RNA helicase 50 isoform A [Micractinium conductrix]|eukprot:PSC73217.1 DEAD-box ATP-dependent RNA helicase 50 isoform A [Micractinium conductrix]